ncbi:MAG: SCO family protein [Bacteroidetes bacterium]|nr:SCO family protein [Bacteroidota bacterium]
MSNKRFFIGIAVAVLLPLSFYLVISFMSKSQVPHLPAYFIAEGYNADTKDSIYHKVGELELINQFGERVSLNKGLKGKMLVVNFIFTHCATTCPKQSANMLMLQNAFRKDPKKENNLDTAVHFISITVDPTNDSFQELRAYADKYHANPDHWWFLTGDRATIYDYARKQLFVTMQPGDGGLDDFIHSEKFVLIDTARYIRGYYNGTDPMDVNRCANDIVILTKQKSKRK